MICPAEQTCIVDSEVYDEMLAEFERMGAHLLTTEQAEALTEFAFGCGDKVNMAALGQQAPELAARAGFTVPRGDQDPPGRRSRPTSTSSPPTRWCRRS